MNNPYRPPHDDSVFEAVLCNLVTVLLVFIVNALIFWAGWVSAVNYHGLIK